MDAVRRTIDIKVTEAGDRHYLAVARLVDPFHEMEVRLTVRTADLTVVEAVAYMDWIPYDDRRPDSLAHMSGLEGVQIGPGLTRIVRDSVGGPSGCPYLVDLVLQACKLVVVALGVQRAREAVLVQNDIEAFSSVRAEMGSCAGHRDLPADRLPRWLERERDEDRTSRLAENPPAS